MKNIKDIISFVHQEGLWQSENCYKTEVVEDKGMLIIYNHNTYGSKEEQELCQDTVVLEIEPKERKTAKIKSVTFGDITKERIIKYNFLLDYYYYSQYSIRLEEDK